MQPAEAQFLQGQRKEVASTHATTQMHINMFCLSHHHMSFISFRNQTEARRVGKIHKYAAIVLLYSHTFLNLSFTFSMIAGHPSLLHRTDHHREAWETLWHPRNSCKNTGKCNPLRTRILGNKGSRILAPYQPFYSKGN